MDYFLFLILFIFVEFGIWIEYFEIIKKNYKRFE